VIKNPVSHLSSVLLALLVTFLWSTSFIIIKICLEEMPSLIFAGMRYILAFLILLPFVFKEKDFLIIKNLTGKEWQKLYVDWSSCKYIFSNSWPQINREAKINPLIITIISM